MEFIIIGIVTALNFIVIKAKIERKRYEDAVFDFCMLIVLAFLFAGSYAGMVVAMTSSLVISLYLLFSPPKMVGSLVETFKTKAEEFRSGKPASKKPENKEPPSDWS
jgi:Ca2+/Na+ antiporter